VLTKKTLNKRFYKHEKFGIVPIGWDVVRLGDYFDFFPTASYSHSLLTDTGECPYIHYGALHTKFERFIDASKDELPFITKEMAKKYTSILEGDLIISDASEDYKGVGKAVEVINVGDKTIISGLHTLHLRAKNNEFINGFKGYVLNESRVRNSILRSATGIKVYSVSKTELKKIYLPKPPVEEQTAIATILSKVDDAIKATENSIKAAEKLKKSLMQNLLTGKLKPDGTWRTKDEFYKDEKFGDVPVGWEVKKVKAVATEIQYGLNSSADENGTIPMFRMNNIIKGKMVANPMVYVQLSPIEKAKYQLQIGDILFNRTNSMDLVGKVGIFDLEGEYVFASYLIKISVNSDNNPFFINYVLNSYPVQCSLRSKATPAVSQANINANSLSNTHLVLPQKDEQTLIAERLNSLEKSMEYRDVKVRRLQILKKALMQNLLTGKIRVDVNKVKNLLNEE